MAMAGGWHMAPDLSVFSLIIALMEPGLADLHVARVTAVHNSRISTEVDGAPFSFL